MSKSKRKQSDQVKRAAATNCASAIRVDRIDLTDRLEEGCAQALGIASLLIEADADVVRPRFHRQFRLAVGPTRGS